MGNCFKKRYPEGSEALLLSEYNELSTIQLDSNTNNIARLNEKYSALESNFNQLDNSINKLDNNSDNNLKSLSEDVHHLNQEIIKIREEVGNLQNTNKILIKKLSSN